MTPDKSTLRFVAQHINENPLHDCCYQTAYDFGEWLAYVGGFKVDKAAYDTQFILDEPESP